MVIAIGMKTGKIYAYGKYRSEVMRKLDKKYHYKKQMKDDRTNTGRIYPEPLLLRKVRGNEMSILQSPTERHSRVSRTLETV